MAHNLTFVIRTADYSDLIWKQVKNTAAVRFTGYQLHSIHSEPGCMLTTMFLILQWHTKMRSIVCKSEWIATTNKPTHITLCQQTPFQGQPEAISGAVWKSHRSRKDGVRDDASVFAEGRSGGAAEGVGALGAWLDRQLGAATSPSQWDPPPQYRHTTGRILFRQLLTLWISASLYRQRHPHHSQFDENSCVSRYKSYHCFANTVVVCTYF